MNSFEKLKIIEVNPSTRVQKTPEKIEILFSNSVIKFDEISIFLVELRQYFEKNDPLKGDYYLITSFVETDKGTVEIPYEEGYFPKKYLEKTAFFVKSQLGLSGIITRSMIPLNTELKNKN